MSTFTGLFAAGVQVIDDQSFTVSGSWNKPAGALPDDNAFIYLLGGGGGGRNSAGLPGGQGGDGAVFQCKVRDLPSVAAIVIGAGGSPDTDGSDTSFTPAIVVKGGKSGLVPAGNASVNPGYFSKWSQGVLGAASTSPSASSFYGGPGGVSTGTPGSSIFWGSTGGTAAADNAGTPGAGGGTSKSGRRGQVRVVITRG